jgi:hypothetical protein
MWNVSLRNNTKEKDLLINKTAKIFILDNFSIVKSLKMSCRHIF